MRHGIIVGAMLTACSGSNPYDLPTQSPKYFTLTLTGVTAVGSAYEEDASVDGLPLEGATLTLSR